MRYENLIGDRYLSLEEGAGSVRRLQPGQTIPLDRTSPALDVDALIGGFRPLFRALDPDQVNALSGELLKVFQGQGGTISSVLSQTSALTTTLAGRDELIGEVITNLNTVLGTFATRDDQFSEGLDKLSQFVAGTGRPQDRHRQRGGLHQRRGGIGCRPVGRGAPTDQGHRGADRSVRRARSMADHDYVDDLVKTLPDAYQVLARQGLYGDYFGFYLCDAILKVNGKGGQPVFVKLAGQDPRDGAHRNDAVHTEATTISSRWPSATGSASVSVGILVVVAVVIAAFSYDKIPFIKGTSDYSAYFAEAGGIKPGSDVRVSGLAVGRVSNIHLEGTKVRVDFTVRQRRRDWATAPRPRSRPRPCWAAKMLEVTPRGDGELDRRHPARADHVALRPADRAG